jgi:hypothetical protein
MVGGSANNNTGRLGEDVGDSCWVAQPLLWVVLLIDWSVIVVKVLAEVEVAATLLLSMLGILDWEEVDRDAEMVVVVLPSSRLFVEVILCC